MFINYSKLAKELLVELKEDSTPLKEAMCIEEATKEIMEKFVELCLDDLIKLKRIEVLSEANTKDFIGEMRVAVKTRIEKEIKSSIDKILEV